jgi:hypothetical protein
MKKLKLRLANVEGAEMLSREQLKTVMGGSGSGGTGGSGGGINDGKCASRENDTVKCCPNEGAPYTGICKELLGNCPSIIGEYETCPTGGSGGSGS